MYSVRSIGLTIITGLIVIACNKVENPTENPFGEDFFAEGVFIANEGLFQSGTGTLSFYNILQDTLVNEVYQAIHDQPLGNIVQSLSKIDQYLVVIVNNANHVRYLNYPSLSKKELVTDIQLPRFSLAVSDDMLAVSSWTEPFLHFINVDDQVNTSSLLLHAPADKLLKNQSDLLVLHQGGFGIDSTISIVNLNDFSLNQVLQVYPKPTGIALVQDHIWVLCSGKGWNGITQEDDTEGHLICITKESYEVINDIAFPNTQQHPEKLVVMNNEKLLFLYQEGVCYYDLNLEQIILDQPLITNENSFYGLAYDDKNHLIYATDPVNYSEAGWFKIYNEEGTIIDSLRTGIIPGEMLIVK